MVHEQLEDILRESRRLAIPDAEKNIFSIGGRGHYEGSSRFCGVATINNNK